MKAAAKRVSRSYKATDKIYNKAMRRAKKEKKALASIVESLVFGYAYEFDKDEANNPKNNKAIN